MAEYVKGLGEMLASKKGKVVSYSEEVDELMKQADDPYGRFDQNMPEPNMKRTYTF